MSRLWSTHKYEPKHSEECMCRLRNIAMRDNQGSVTTGQTDAGQSDPYVASQATQ